MTPRFDGRVRRLGDHVNTDYIIASRRKKLSLDESVLRHYLLEAVDPGFAASVQPGDVLVAGRNFGCGSAMEVAVTVILAAGIQVVIAESFARAFYRNAVNNGLTPVIAPTAGLTEGDPISVATSAEGLLVTNHRTGATLTGPALPEAMGAILEAGGLVPYVRRHGRLPG